MKISVSSLVFSIIVIAIHIQTVIAKPDDKFINRLHSTESASTLFIENRGQIGDQNGMPNPEVKYLILRPGLNIQLKKNSFSYDGYTIDKFKKKVSIQEPMHHEKEKNDNDSMVYHFHRVDIELVDANPNPQITHEGASSDYLNYYTHITAQTKGEEGVTGVRGYNKVSYLDIYPNIDLEWFLDKDGKPEYQFIIKPGGDPSRIRLKYHGAQKTELISDALHIHVKHGIIKEHIPLSYVQESKEKLNISFTKINENEYGFIVPRYALNETLVIDPVPNRMWGTYYGGSDEDIFNGEVGLDIDATDNLYLIGTTKSLSDIASNGAWDQVLSGTRDVFLAKFNSSGSRIWSTYYGGNGSDYGRDIVVDGVANIYIVGNSNSDSEIATTGTWDDTKGIESDAFLAKFTTNGTRIWGTYFGGDSFDYGSSITIDVSGNICIGGTTSSTSDIASIGSWDESYSGGMCDAFLAKFTPNGYRLWGTYYGGSGCEGVEDLVIDNLGNIYFSGSTQSGSDIASSGAWDVTYAGNYDAFLVKFSSSGMRLWGTYCGGGIYEDYGIALSIDLSGNVFLTGSTASSIDIASTGAWDTTYGGNMDVFLAKFSTAGSRLWGTYYGGESLDESTSLSIDETGNIYLTGRTHSQSGMSTTGAWDSSYNGGNGDAFIANFTSSGSRNWSSYYGGNELDTGLELNLDNSDNIILIGKTSSSTDIVSTGGWDVTFAGGISTDVFIVKFDKGNQISTPTISSNSYCKNQEFTLPFTVTGTYISTNTFTAQLSDKNGSFTSPTTIGTKNSTSSGSISCTIPTTIESGSAYRIRIVSSNPVVTGSDNGTNITIHPSPQPVITGSGSTCVSEQTTSYSVPQVTGHTYSWTPTIKGNIIGSQTGNAINVRWNVHGTDTLKLRQTNSTTGCFKDTNLIITINPSPLPKITGISSVCVDKAPETYSVELVSGNTYLWFAPTKGTIDGGASGNSVKIRWTSVGSDTLTVRQTNPITGCSKDTFIVVTIQQVPKPNITGEAIVCSKNTISTFRVDSKSGYTISWSTPKNGRIIGSNSRDSVVVEWLSSGIDTVYVRYTDAQTGCFEETKKAVLIGNPLTPSIQGSASTCIDSVPVTYRTRYQAGQSYGWSKPRLGTINGAINLDSVQIEWNASGQDTLILREFTIATGCFKDTSLIITVNPRPQPSISGKSELVEYSQSNVYSVPNESGSSYEWSIVEGEAEIEKKNVNSIELKSGKSGNVIIKVVQTTVEGCKNEAKYTITVKSVTGITESRSKSFSVYPNPNNGQEELIVELPFTSLNEMRIELIDVLGITRYEGMIPSQTVRHTIQLSDMPKGMYTIRLIMRDGVLSEKVIVE
jgi:hypothetical protein